MALDGGRVYAPKVGGLKAARASAGDVENLLEVLVERIEQAFFCKTS